MANVKMVLGPSKKQLEFVGKLADCTPGMFKVLSEGSKGKKDDDYYYVVKLHNGAVTILSSGLLLGFHEEGIPVFINEPVVGSEVELLPTLRIGVKDHKFVVE